MEEMLFENQVSYSFLARRPPGERNAVIDLFDIWVRRFVGPLPCEAGRPFGIIRNRKRCSVRCKRKADQNGRLKYIHHNPLSVNKFGRIIVSLIFAGLW